MGRRLQFDTKGNEKQKEVARLWLDDSVTDILYAGTKGAGKSYLGCSLIAGDADVYKRQGEGGAESKLCAAKWQTTSLTWPNTSSKSPNS